jgi:hypothetical protein
MLLGLALNNKKLIFNVRNFFTHPNDASIKTAPPWLTALCYRPAGSKRAIKIPRMAITTNNSTKVKPNRGCRILRTANIARGSGAGGNPDGVGGLLAQLDSQAAPLHPAR